MKKNRWTSYFNILLFLVPLFFLGTLNFSMPNKPTVSQLESRTLKTKPTFALNKLFSGELTREYEEYFADTFIFRENFVKISGKIKELWALPGSDNVTLVINKGANVAEVQKDKDNSPSTSNNSDDNEYLKQGNEENENPNTTNINNEDEQAKGEVLGRVLVLNDKAMEIHTFNAAACEYYASFLNSFQEKLNDNNISVYSLLAPTQIEFVTNKRYRNLSSPQKKTIEYVNKNFNAKIIPINAYDALKPNTDKYLYFRSDHHWTALGAYYAYTAFMKTKGIEPIPLERYEVEQVSPYLGSLYSTTLGSKIRENPDTVFLYKPFIAHEYTVYYEGPLQTALLDMSHAKNKNKYGIFLSGDRPWGRITTEIKNDRKIVIIKDSYANAFVPFLLPHYEEIYIVDPRQFKLNIFQFIKDKGIQEVLFLNYILVTDHNGFTDLLKQMSK